MDQRTPSYSKVVPTHVETPGVAVNDKSGDDCPSVSPVDVKLDATIEATLPGTLRYRFPQQPGLSAGADVVSPSSATNDGGVATLERRRAKSFSEWSMARTIYQASDQPKLRRHSSGMTRSRPTTVVMARETGESFYDVFGALGVPMVLAFIFSAAAIFNQAYVQMYPSDFANLLMNTTHYDEGEFWLLEKTRPSTVAIATAMLVFFGCCYLVLVTYMLFFRHWAIEKKPNNTVLQQNTLTKLTRRESLATSTATRESTTTEGDDEITVAEIAKGVLLTNLEFLRDALATSFPRLITRQQQAQSTVTAGADAALQRKNAAMARRKLQRARAIYFQFSDIDGIYHAYYSAMYDIPKLAFQTTTLVAYLRKGFPIAIVAFYCTMLSVNWFISFYRFQRKTFDKALLVARIFYLFDLFFAVFAPLLILTYSYYNFHFDREVFHTKEEAFLPGEFERTARLFADPNQVSVIRLGFNHLTLTTGSSIGIKFGLLYLSIYKWRKIIRFLIQTHHKNRRQMKESHTAKQRKQTHHHLVLGVIAFLIFGIGTLVYTIGSLVMCKKNCAGQENCAVISYKWQWRHEGCPCLVYISRKLDPRTYNEWLYPEDVTGSLNEAARAGALKSIQIINRALPTLPDALRQCKDLQQLILIYTETEEFPDWTKELTHLEYMYVLSTTSFDYVHEAHSVMAPVCVASHIEGDFTPRRLKYLPLDMFSHMHHLHYLYTGTIPQLRTYPSLDGLGELETLTIVSGHSLVELPSFDDMVSLSSLNLVENYHVHRLPSLHALTDLRGFNVVYRNEVCCNGYLTGVCDRLTPMCRKYNNASEIQCARESISTDDKAIIAKTQGEICTDLNLDLEDNAPSLQSTDVACGGVLYRQCHMGNATGMCYNARMLVVTCETSGRYELMRRLQIERNIGDECDPNEEAWLGCQ